MPRALDDYEPPAAQHEVRQEVAGRLDRRAAWAFAAAMASLLVATLVVNQSAESLEAGGTEAANSFEVGTINLSDDDAGRSLVNLPSMVPGRPSTECIAVSYEGTILPVEVELRAEVVGELAPFVEARIESGDDGGFGRCDEFVPDETLFEGSLQELADGGPLPVDVYLNQGDRTSFRFRFELADTADALGKAVSLDVVWEVVPA